MDESFAASAAGEVLDAGGVAAWASGRLGMQTWFGIAWELWFRFYLIRSGTGLAAGRGGAPRVIPHIARADRIAEPRWSPGPR